MDKNKRMKLGLWLISALLICACGLAGCQGQVQKVQTEEKYQYIKPNATRAEADEGFTIDGILDEAVYQEKNWLYLSHHEDGADVDIAMTSHYGEKGIYIVYDVTEGNPIYVNLNRGSTLNSSIEMYLSLGSFESITHDGFFEIDLLPTGNVIFKQANGKGGYINVATTNDIMAVLGATTKGGPVNTPECSGYCLELFIPWDYLDWLGLDSDALRQSTMYINPAHITSFNETGKSNSLDRFWYQFVEKKGGSFGSVFTHYRFDGNGVQDTVPVTYEAEKCSIQGPKAVIPGMENTFTFIPENGSSLTSIIIDGKEYIHLADQKEDGSVTLSVRGLKDAMTVSAKAETIAAGNKTLGGKVTVQDGKMEDLQVSYKGPKGELPVEVNEDGSFQLEDLQQGYYSLIVEKEGYSRLIRSVLLNRDMTLELTLEKPVFEITSGNAWLTDGEREGSVHKMAGSGIILSEESYNRFTFEAKFRYDAALAEQSDHDYFTQQRQGMRIAFSNGMNWRIDLVRENDIFHVQYAGAGETTLFKWKSAYKLTQAEIKKYCSEEGITLRVERDGRYANVYLDNKLVAVEQFDSVYAGCTARVGFEAWTANEGVWEYPYVIKDSVNKYLPGTLFDTAKGWDVTGQYAGYITIPAGGTNKISFINKYGDFDLTLRVQDHPESIDKEGTYPRNDVLLNFDNGTNVSFGIACHNGKAIVQCLNQGDDTSKHIYKKYKWWYDLTAEEQAQYENGGVDLRIVRIGTEVTLYVNGKMVGVADLTNNGSGVTQSDRAKITIRHYDDTGVWIPMPVKMAGAPASFTIEPFVSQQGQVTTQKQNYMIGDTVVISGVGAEGYYCTGLTVDGAPVAMAQDGTYRFTATKQEYVLAGTFAKQLFLDNAGWDLTRQHMGVLVPTPADGAYTSYLTTKENYNGFTLTFKEPAGAKKGFAVGGQFYFANGKFLVLQLMKTNDGYQLRSASQNANCLFRELTYYTLTAQQVSKLQNEGITLKAVRTGTIVQVYLDDTLLTGLSVSGKTADYIDLKKDSNNADTGITGDTTAIVKFAKWGAVDAQPEIAFTLTPFSTSTVQVNCAEAANGKVTADRAQYVAGDTVTVTCLADEGYVCSALTVNGQPVTLSGDTYSFVAVAESYEISASFALAPPDTVALQLVTDGNGEITPDQASYLVGDQVTVTVTPNSGYSCAGLYVDGVQVAADWSGVYSFTTEKAAYQVQVEFAENIFLDNGGWNESKQHSGLLLPTPGDGAYTSYLTTKGNYNGFTLSFQEPAGAKAGFAVGGQFYFANGKFLVLQLMKTNDGYQLRSASQNANCLFRELTYCTLTAQQVSKLQNEGITLKAVRTGTIVQVYLDDTLLTGLSVSGKTADYIDLKKDSNNADTGITGDTTAIVKFAKWGAVDTQPEIAFTLTPFSTTAVNVSCAAAANGKVTADKESYFVGDTVTLTVAPDADYYYTGLYVDGTPVDVNWDGTYSFVATKESYTVTCGFDKTLFTGGMIKDWVLFKQHVGELKVKDHSSSHSGYIDSVNNCNDVTVVVKDHNPDDRLFNMQYRFTFSNGETFYIRINHEDADGVYRIQAIKDGNTLFNAWTNKHDFTAEETAAITGDGIKFRVIVLNNAAHVYLNDVKVCEYAFTKDVGDATVKVTLRMNGNYGHDVYMTYALANTTELP